MINKLVDGFSLEDRKPSELLIEMQSVAPADVPKGVMKALWLRLLPSNVRLVLSTVEDNLEETFKLADSAH